MWHRKNPNEAKTTCCQPIIGAFAEASIKWCWTRDQVETSLTFRGSCISQRWIWGVSCFLLVFHHKSIHLAVYIPFWPYCTSEFIDRWRWNWMCTSSLQCRSCRDDSPRCAAQIAQRRIIGSWWCWWNPLLHEGDITCAEEWVCPMGDSYVW